MTDVTYAGDKLLDAWLNLSSTLWNTRLVSSLTFNEAHVMGILLRHSTDAVPMTATDLIRHTRLLKSQMNKILTSLEKREYITRCRAELDKRLIHIRLTETGAVAYQEEHKGIEAFLGQLVEQFGAERALNVAQELSDITAVLDNILPVPK